MQTHKNNNENGNKKNNYIKTNTKMLRTLRCEQIQLKNKGQLIYWIQHRNKTKIIWLILIKINLISLKIQIIIYQLVKVNRKVILWRKVDA